MTYYETIPLTPEVKDRLKALKGKKETFTEVIRKLLDKADKD